MKEEKHPGKKLCQCGMWWIPEKYKYCFDCYVGRTAHIDYAKKKPKSKKKV